MYKSEYHFFSDARKHLETLNTPFTNNILSIIFHIDLNNSSFTIVIFTMYKSEYHFFSDARKHLETLNTPFTNNILSIIFHIDLNNSSFTIKVTQQLYIILSSAY